MSIPKGMFTLLTQEAGEEMSKNWEALYANIE